MNDIAEEFPPAIRDTYRKAAKEFRSLTGTGSSACGPAEGPNCSLEDFHGNYHLLIGNTRGHMSAVVLPAFDPIFWFQHWMALNGTFTIYFFIGGVPGDDIPVSHYVLFPTLAGNTHIFAAPAEACDNCGQQRDAAQLESGTVPINPILLDHVIAGSLVDITPDRVKRFLVQNFRWRVIDVSLSSPVAEPHLADQATHQAAGNRVDTRSVADLQIGISSKLTPLDGSGYIGLEEYPEVVQQIIEQSS
ncbi:putative tyrosinase [Seiridium unicorne]|uniref:Tyrosinase n=1 Tax=Seiridium unicorne TaxID=138068 RepID=A0ABR2UFJ6_9PEZI